MINVPTWWRDLPRLERAADILHLRDEAKKAGVSVNDKINIEKMWFQILMARDIARANKKEIEI